MKTRLVFGLAIAAIVAGSASYGYAGGYVTFGVSTTTVPVLPPVPAYTYYYQPQIITTPVIVQPAPVVVYSSPIIVQPAQVVYYYPPVVRRTIVIGGPLFGVRRSHIGLSRYRFRGHHGRRIGHFSTKRRHRR